jgi:DNA (cytosine-5)-methyltransferase 1
MISASERDGVIELFAGAGGFTWGWRRAGFRTLVAVDNDPVAARTHEINFGKDHTLSLNRDLTRFRPEELRALLGHRPHSLLALVGGPPCQGWSKAGRGKLRSLPDRARSLLHDPRNGLYRVFLDYVNHFRPPLCVMENVPGMLSIEGVNVADLIVQHFADVDYDCTYHVVNARWFGVPQDRRRIIFVGSRRDTGLIVNAGDLETFATDFRSRLAHLPGETTFRQAVADLPVIPPGHAEDPQIYRASAGRKTQYVELMRQGSDGVVADHVTRGYNSQDIEAFRHMHEGMIYAELPKRFKRYRDDIFRDKYKKLYWDRPAYTVTAHLAKDCYTHIHPDQARTISVREAARIQSFPDNFRFFGHVGHRFRQIGNAVPPLMAWGIAEFIRSRLSQGS